MPANKIGRVVSCAPNSIIVEISDLQIFEEHKQRLQVGKYIQIADGNRDYVLAVIRNITGINDTRDGTPSWRFNLECQAIGALSDGEHFVRGSVLLPVPTEPAFVVEDNIFELIFSEKDEFSFPLGSLSVNKQIPFKVNGDRFFGKHIAVVGSTGSGKSCTVAQILHQAVGISARTNKHVSAQKNSHIIIFDIHSEYHVAFRLDPEQKFSLNTLNVDKLALPYWLMNSEELESIFIESNEENSHNQVSQFKHAVIENKRKHNPTLKEITYDSPIYFSIREVLWYIKNVNREVVSKVDDCPKLADKTLVTQREKVYFEKEHEFIATSRSSDSAASNGPFYGQFNRFVSRLETRLNDSRLKFLLDPRKSDEREYRTDDFDDLVRQFLGYLNRSNVTIVDLSGVPFEVLSITVSLIARLAFDFCFHYSKLRHSLGQSNDAPVMIVCEEAHNYVPQKASAEYRASKKSIERIAKEGRKYGLSLMVVSQRPSEVSETIMAQCSNFVALRLTNDADQAYIKRLLPDNSSSITDVLPILSPGECVVVGDATLLPAVIQVSKPNPEPQSQGVPFHQEWRKDWAEVAFSDVVRRWRKG
ncbi:ATP-binding protein [Pyxidicoccus sp. 3LFB2]